jgi:predicted nucleotidyltransferase
MAESSKWLNCEDIVMILRELNPQIKKEYKAEIVGFWFICRGEQRKDSDLDIWFNFKIGASLLDFAGLADFLEDELGIKIDLVSKRAIRPELKEQKWLRLCQCEKRQKLFFE